MISYKLAIKQKPAFLHAIVTGQNSSDNVAAYLQELFQVCVSRGCTRLLIEERLDGPRLGTLDVFEIASEGSRQAMGFFKAVAYVDVNAKGDLMQFAESVAVNRALPAAVFSTVSAAETWLLEKHDDSDEPIAEADANTPPR